MLLLKRLNGVVSDQTNAELMADWLINIDSVKEKAPKHKLYGGLQLGHFSFASLSVAALAASV